MIIQNQNIFKKIEGKPMKMHSGVFIIEDNKIKEFIKKSCLIYFLNDFI